MSEKPFLKKPIVKGLALLGLIAVAIVAYLIAANTTEEVSGMAVSASTLTDQLRPFRWGLIALTFLLWNHLVPLWGQWKNLSEERMEYAKSLRWRLLAYTVLFEVVIIESLPSKLLGV